MSTIALPFPYRQSGFNSGFSFRSDIIRKLTYLSNAENQVVQSTINNIKRPTYIPNEVEVDSIQVPIIDYTVDAMISENLRRLSDIEKLIFDWDGEGAKPIPSACVKYARDILADLSPQPIAAPTVCETIMLQYIQRSDSIFTINIHLDKIEVFYMINHGSGGKRKEVFSPGKEAIENIKVMVSEFFEQE